MIGTLDTTRREVTVIGAGISGMLAAYYLDRRDYRVTLIEEKNRAGGLIRTTCTAQGIAESAAHSLVATPPVLELCRDLNVPLVEPRKEAKAKYIVRNGRLRRFPLSIPEALSTLARATFVNSVSDNGQSLEGWGQRHLGQPAVDYLLTPLVRGIYGVQPAELGVGAAYPALRLPAGQTLIGSFLKKRKAKTNQIKKRVAPQLGMGDLVKQLELRLHSRLGPRFRKDERVKSLPDVANLIIATPAYDAARLVENDSWKLAQQLESVKYTPIVSVTVFVERSAFTNPVEGVGVLMPACEDRSCLGILFNSSSFTKRVTDEDKLASFTVMMGGTSQAQWLNATDEEIEVRIRYELKSLLGIQDVSSLLIHRWPTALPQYSTALPDVWQYARTSWCAVPGRMLFGNYTGQISLRGMIESAAQLC
ncbi:MAG TPA: FAD-dependent oxidoreductase [Pyrinomonadaceae bacterium]